MKFVLDKLGFEEFSKRWKESYDSLIQSGATKLGLIPGVFPDEPALIMPTKNGNGGSAQSNGHGSTNGSSQNGEATSLDTFTTWCATNVISQRQPGFKAAAIRLRSGDPHDRTNVPCWQI